MNQSVVGIVHTRIEAENLVSALKSASFTDNDISALFPDKEEESKDFAHDNSTKAPEGAVAGASTGGVLGGALGLLDGIGVLAKPRTIAPTEEPLAGPLVGMGIPQYEAKMYEDKVRDGNILLAVQCANNDRAKCAQDLYKQNKATDIHHVDETAV